jgi:hypothetical protein
MSEKNVKDISAVKIPTPAIEDHGTVRMGLVSPAFPPVRATPANLTDGEKVRIGLVSPAFPPARAR